MIPVPEGIDPNSLMSKIPEEEEFSQEHIGEVISTTDIVDEEEMLRIFGEENQYLKNWTNHEIIRWVNRYVESSIF
jgi:hypothetical protein